MAREIRIHNHALRDLRKHLKLTQEQLAEKIDVFSAHLSQVEAGAHKKGFSVEVWIQIQDIYGKTLKSLGYDFEALVRGDKKNPPKKGKS